MKWIGTKNVSLPLLGAWLIATGLLPRVEINFVNLRMILSVLATSAGSMLLLGR